MALVKYFFRLLYSHENTKERLPWASNNEQLCICEGVWSLINKPGYHRRFSLTVMNNLHRAVCGCGTMRVWGEFAVVRQSITSMTCCKYLFPPSSRQCQVNQDPSLFIGFPESGCQQGISITSTADAQQTETAGRSPMRWERGGSGLQERKTVKEESWGRGQKERKRGKMESC